MVDAPARHFVASIQQMSFVPLALWAGVVFAARARMAASIDSSKPLPDGAYGSSNVNEEVAQIQKEELDGASFALKCLAEDARNGRLWMSDPKRQKGGPLGSALQTPRIAGSGATSDKGHSPSIRLATHELNTLFGNGGSREVGASGIGRNGISGVI